MMRHYPAHVLQTPDTFLPEVQSSISDPAPASPGSHFSNNGGFRKALCHELLLSLFFTAHALMNEACQLARVREFDVKRTTRRVAKGVSWLPGNPPNDLWAGLNSIALCRYA